MTHERIDAVWIEEHRVLSLDELHEQWGLARGQLEVLLEHGILEPDASGAAGPAFTLETAALARTACSRQAVLDLDPHAVGVVLSLLARVRELESELAALRAALSDPEAAPE
jgi:hypothetical protein